MMNWQRLALTVFSLTIPAAALAQSGPQFPPPAAGQYRCTLSSLIVNTPLQFTQKYDVFNNQINVVLAPTPTFGVNVQLSALGLLNLDGKGNYTQLSGQNKVIGKGTYTYDKAQKRLNFKGSLADGNVMKYAGYVVRSSGSFSIFFSDGRNRHECFLKVNGNPLPQKARANDDLSGRILVTGASSSEFDLVTGQQTWEGNGATYTRLPGGLTLIYGLDFVRDTGQFVFQTPDGQRITEPVQRGATGSFVNVSTDGQRVLFFAQVRGQSTPDNLFGGMVSTYPLQILDRQGRVIASTREDFVNGGSRSYLTPAFLPDGRVLLPIEQDHQLYVYTPDLQSRKVFAPDAVMPAVSPDGQRVAMLTGGRTVTITDTSGKVLNRIPVPESVTVAALTFSPDSKTLAFTLKTEPLYSFLAFAPVNGKEMSWLENRSGEPLKIPNNGIHQGNTRMSWWTGQYKAPVAVSTSQSTRPPGQTTPQQPQQPRQPNQTPGNAQEPASTTPWPKWLPRATVTITDDPDVNGKGQLNLNDQQDNGDYLQITGTLDGQLNAGYAYYPKSNKRVLLLQFDGDLYVCMISQTQGTTLTGDLYFLQDNQPQATGGHCRITP